MTVQSRQTSFFTLTNDTNNSDVGVNRIEIPMFQRDYAQGRGDKVVAGIRDKFLDVLLGALAPNSAPVGLDFVYGEVIEGTLRPLDGQQRLTTLFLLHWYVACRSGNLDNEHGWTKFSYATRDSARLFCQSLVEHHMPELPDKSSPSKWLEDQPWYLYVWHHDPTVQSMLVMLDAIHAGFKEKAIDPAEAWRRLTDTENPAIWFLLLPLCGLGTMADGGMRSEDLYIKMNSRGKPLTEFENFKAHFERTIQWSTRSSDFALKVDTTWSDLFWRVRGDDNIIDDELLRYLTFITEVCEWRDGRTDGVGHSLEERAKKVFGEGNQDREATLEFLFQAFDIWCDTKNTEIFSNTFTNKGDPAEDGSKIRLFFRSASDTETPVDLFETCCQKYGDSLGGSRKRAFSLGQTLMLYAVVLHLVERTDDFPRRVRWLRNLLEASSDELRDDRTPGLIKDVHCVIRHGAVESVTALNQAQVADEIRKRQFLEKHPRLQSALFRLEDHELLHGSLGAFELEEPTFEHRASWFEALMAKPDLWKNLLGALLACGEYQRQRRRSGRFLFGTSSAQHDSAWRDLLTGATLDRLKQTREVLAAFLDRVHEASTPQLAAASGAASAAALESTLKEISEKHLRQCEAEGRFDWRYYMVKYPKMRGGGSSIYIAEAGEESNEPRMGYSLCMLRAGCSQLNSNYRDPYLLAISHSGQTADLVEDKWFTGYELRKLPLKNGATIRCVHTGFEVTAPPNGSAEQIEAALSKALQKRGVDLSGTPLLIEVPQVDAGVSSSDTPVSIKLPQVDVSGRGVDTIDRIELGAKIVQLLSTMNGEGESVSPSP